MLMHCTLITLPKFACYVPAVIKHTFCGLRPASKGVLTAEQSVQVAILAPVCGQA